MLTYKYKIVEFAPDQKMEKTFNELGKEGWELVSTYTETATAFPNFGNSDYVTGIRDNTRTSVVNFVFKRQSDGKEESNAKPEKKK